MTNDEIKAAIETERHKQNALWPRDVTVNPQRAQYRYFAPHILVLEEKIARLRSTWYGSDREKLRAEFVKIAAIAQRALEEVE